MSTSPLFERLELLIEPGPQARCLTYTARHLALQAGCTHFWAGAAAAAPALEPSTLRLVHGSMAAAAAASSERGTSGVPRDSVIIALPDAGFFGEGRWLTRPDLPVEVSTLRAVVLPAEGAPAAPLLAPTASGSPEGAGRAEAAFDLLAVAFWFMSRYEEVLAGAPRDEHGRFLAARSAAPADLYSVPVANRLFARLLEEAAQHRPQGYVPPKRSAMPPPQVVALTHDVDLLRKYAPASFLKKMARALGAGAPSPTAEAAQQEAEVRAGRRADPFDSFEQFGEVRRKINSRSTWFVMASGPRGKFAPDYDLADRRMADLIQDWRMAGDEVALHASYGADARTIGAERTALAKATGRPVAGSRHHYLTLNAADGPAALAEAAVPYDSSLGFADLAGFRCGWAGGFRPFDWKAQQGARGVVEIPLNCMDITLAKYEQISAEHIMERLAKLLEASDVPGGALCVLWHNQLADGVAYPGYWDAMVYFFAVATGAVEFKLMGEIASEFEARWLACQEHAGE